MNKASVYAKHRYARISPKKVAPVMDLVRGKNVREAKVILTFDRTKASGLVLKVLKSAVANARNNLNLDESKLYIADLQVSPAPTFKRHRFVGRGHVSPILKRNCHISLGLSERSKK